jgi:hypothetical protein
MADNLEHLKSMLRDMIDNKEEQASVSLHNYLVAKTREVSGLGALPAQTTPAAADTNTD